MPVAFGTPVSLEKTIVVEDAVRLVLSVYPVPICFTTLLASELL